MVDMAPKTKKRTYDKKETKEQFFSGSSGLPGSSPLNEVDHHVHTSTVCLSNDRRPHHTPSDLSTSSALSFNVNSLSSLRQPEVTGLHS